MNHSLIGSNSNHAISAASSQVHATVSSSFPSVAQVNPTDVSGDGSAPHSSQLSAGISQEHSTIQVDQRPAPSPSASDLSAIGSQEPIAHEVGMLSLANSSEPKYVGPSSGVAFARLIYAAAPHRQGFAANLSGATHDPPDEYGLERFPRAGLPAVREANRFIDVYFEILHPLYPFLDEAAFRVMAKRILTNPPSSFMASTTREMEADQIDRAQLFLILFLGARLLELRLSQNFQAETYFATAVTHTQFLSLHDHLRGIQTLLLLSLSSLQSPYGMNVWFLKSVILAGCIDLGLQRKSTYRKYSMAPAQYLPPPACLVFVSIDRKGATYIQCFDLLL